MTMGKPRGLYVPVYQSLPEHPKVLAAAKALRCDRIKMVGHLVTLWAWYLDKANGSALIQDTIAFAARWPERQASAFVDALVNAGLLDVVDGGYVPHDWDEYGGKVAQKQVYDRTRHAADKAPEARAHTRKFPGDSEEVPRNFPGDSALDETRREKKRSHEPDPPLTPPKPVTVANPVGRRLWEVCERLSGRISLPRVVEEQVSAWVAAGVTEAQIESAEAEIAGWETPPERPLQAFMAALGRLIARADDERGRGAVSAGGRARGGARAAIGGHQPRAGGGARVSPLRPRRDALGDDEWLPPHRAGYPEDEPVDADDGAAARDASASA